MAGGQHTTQISPSSLRLVAYGRTARTVYNGIHKPLLICGVENNGEGQWRPDAPSATEQAGQVRLESRGRIVAANTHQFVCVYGHFYQPPREDPFTERIPTEPGAAPYANFNEKIDAECYRPNAEEGNFARISFDLGPTLASWLEQSDRTTYDRIVASDAEHRARYGVGNALAQAYNHTILPLATARDKRTQIRWGLRDFAHRFGHEAEGLWLAETAFDLETLDILAQEGVRYTVAAPWQAAEPIDPTEPYLIRLPSGRELSIFFYNGPLSGGVSFDSNMTNNADDFAHTQLPAHLNPAKVSAGQDQLITIASDGELYGHHKPWRDKFLQRLLDAGAQEAGFEPITLGRYLRDHRATKTVRLTVPSAWSCAHGVARWGAGCNCTEGDPAWKPSLRHAFDQLAARLDAIFERVTARTLADPWAARDDYLSLRNGWMTPADFWARHGIGGRPPKAKLAASQTRQLLDAEYYAQWMYTSCGWFFEDLDRIEPRNDIAFARRAISLVWLAAHTDLQTQFVRDLAQTRSWRTGLTGADIYRGLPREAPDQLPTLVLASATSAA